MQNSSIIKGGICLLLMGLATVDVAQAGFAHLSTMARFAAKSVNSRKILGLTLATFGAEKVVIAQAEEPKGTIDSVTIEHPVAFDKNGVQCQKYGSGMYLFKYKAGCLMAEDKEYPSGNEPLKRDWASWLLNTVVTEDLDLSFGVYNFKMGLRHEVAEVNFKSSQKPLFSRAALYLGEKPNFEYSLNAAPQTLISTFRHILETAVSPDGNREHLSANILQKHVDGTKSKLYVKFERPTRKACESAFYKDLLRVKLPDTPERLEASIQKCIKDGTKIDVSPEVAVIQ